MVLSLLGGRAVQLATFGLGFWQIAIPLIASGVSSLFGALSNKKKKSSGDGTANDVAMRALLGQQQAEMTRNEPLRNLLLGQTAAMLPTYMQQDPQYAKWLTNYGGGAARAMGQAAGPGSVLGAATNALPPSDERGGRPWWSKALVPLGRNAVLGPVFSEGGRRALMPLGQDAFVGPALRDQFRG